MIDRRSLIFSLLLHFSVAILIFSPWVFPQKEWEIAKPVPVRIVPVDVLTQSPPPSSQENFNKFKETTTQEVAAPLPSAEKQPKKEAPSKAEPKVLPLVKKSTKAPAKKAVAALASAPKPALKQEKLPSKDSAKKYDKTFDSLLKSLEKNIEKTSADKTDPKAFDAENISDKLTISELDALRQQIQECWYVQQSVWEDHKIIVEAMVDIGPDRKVTNISIKSPPFGTNRAAFQAAADSVKQALMAPECTPLALPADKHQQWKRSKFIFSPKGVM